jgi:hypothetical protein
MSGIELFYIFDKLLLLLLGEFGLFSIGDLARDLHALVAARQR